MPEQRCVNYPNAKCCVPPTHTYYTHQLMGISITFTYESAFRFGQSATQLQSVQQDRKHAHLFHTHSSQSQIPQGLRSATKQWLNQRFGYVSLSSKQYQSIRINIEMFAQCFFACSAIVEQTRAGVHNQMRNVCVFFSAVSVDADASCLTCATPTWTCYAHM